MLYRIEGDFPDVRFIVEHFIPHTVGDGGAADFTLEDIQPIVMNYMMENECMHLQQGYMHSHHRMSTRPSGMNGDMGDILGNAHNFNQYLFLITNNVGEYEGYVSTVFDKPFGVRSPIFSINPSEHDMRYVGVSECETTVELDKRFVDDQLLNLVDNMTVSEFVRNKTAKQNQLQFQWENSQKKRKVYTPEHGELDFEEAMNFHNALNYDVRTLYGDNEELTDEEMIDNWNQISNGKKRADDDEYDGEDQYGEFKDWF